MSTSKVRKYNNHNDNIIITITQCAHDPRRRPHGVHGAFPGAAARHKRSRATVNGSTGRCPRGASMGHGTHGVPAHAA
jgi:hypothetical protein